MFTPDEQRPRPRAQRPETTPTAAAVVSTDPPPDATRVLRFFQADLDAPPLPFAELTSVLDATECARARRIRSARHRARWIASRGLLRHLLGHETGRAPGTLSFRTTSRGKPFLGADLAFNLSHSRRHLFVGLAPAGDGALPRVGVDVEVVRPVPELEELVRRWFSPAEAASIRARSARAPRHRVEDTARRSFFHAWVRKEAFVKAVGVGIGAPLDAFDVVTRPTECLASDAAGPAGPTARSAAPAPFPPTDPFERRPCDTSQRPPAAPFAAPPSALPSAPPSPPQSAPHPRPPRPDHTSNLLRRNRLPAEAHVPWQVRAVSAPAGAAAAVAWDRPDLELRPAPWPW